MVNTNKLKGLIAEKGLSMSKVAIEMGITPKTMYSKMEKRVFTSKDMENLIKILDIKEPEKIFFSK